MVERWGHENNLGKYLLITWPPRFQGRADLEIWVDRTEGANALIATCVESHDKLARVQGVPARMTGKDKKLPAHATPTYIQRMACWPCINDGNRVAKLWVEVQRDETELQRRRNHGRRNQENYWGSNTSDWGRDAWCWRITIPYDQSELLCVVCWRRTITYDQSELPPGTGERKRTSRDVIKGVLGWGSCSRAYFRGRGVVLPLKIRGPTREGTPPRKGPSVPIQEVACHSFGLGVPSRRVACPSVGTHGAVHPTKRVSKEWT